MTLCKERHRALGVGQSRALRLGEWELNMWHEFEEVGARRTNRGVLGKPP